MTATISAFHSFVEQAKRLRASGAPSPVSEFLKFVQETQHIVWHRSAGTPDAQFKEFIDAASPIVAKEIQELLPRIAERAQLTCRWLVRHDLIWEAGLSYVEDSYTSLMRWALDPRTHPASAAKRQRSWLESMGLDDLCGDEPATPKAWERTDDGIPDLVMHFPGGILVVEAKTGSTEHAAPSGMPQTMAYPEAVRRELGLNREARIEIVFITPDRRAAANPDAKCTTFVEFAIALARALDIEEMHADTRAAYAMVVTHFLTCATPTAVSARELLERVVAWSAQPDWTAPQRILERQVDLLAVSQILFSERLR
ncbi:MAG TPA: hypothetical protein VK797_28305 [Tepidisphaeraceae bacterium]|jgi:hypothetical protein|nr:hypothetical protein [Tepidisphaeraceae bacterium]